MEQNIINTLLKIIQEKDKEIDVLKDQLTSTEYDFVPDKLSVYEARKRWLILKSQKDENGIQDLADEINEEMELVLDMLWYTYYENSPDWVISKYLNVFDSYMNLLIEMEIQPWDSNYESYYTICETLGILEENNWNNLRHKVW